MYPGSLPLIFNGSVPVHEKLFNVHRCSMYTGVQFDRFHCSSSRRRTCSSSRKSSSSTENVPCPFPSSQQHRDKIPRAVKIYNRNNKIDASGVKRLIPCMSFCS